MRNENLLSTGLAGRTRNGKKETFLLLLLRRPLCRTSVGNSNSNSTMSEPSEEIKQFFSSNKVLKNKGKVRVFVSPRFSSMEDLSRRCRIFFNCTNKSPITKRRTNNARTNSMNLFFALFNTRATWPSKIFFLFDSPPSVFFSQTEFSSIWQALIDVTSEIINSYGCLHASSDSQTFDVFFKPLLQEINTNEPSDLYKFLERLLAKINLGFRIATSEVKAILTFLLTLF